MAISLASPSLRCVEAPHSIRVRHSGRPPDVSRGAGARRARVLVSHRVDRHGMSFAHAACSLFGGLGSFSNDAAMRIAPIRLSCDS